MCKAGHGAVEKAKEEKETAAAAVGDPAIVAGH